MTHDEVYNKVVEALSGCWRTFGIQQDQIPFLASFITAKIMELGNPVAS